MKQLLHAKRFCLSYIAARKRLVIHYSSERKKGKLQVIHILFHFFRTTLVISDIAVLLKGIFWFVSVGLVLVFL